MSGEWCNADLREDLDDGRWVDTALVRRSPARVDTLVPHGFDAYARVLHPVRADDEFGRQRWLLRWADIARATGTIPHARMQLESLLAPVPEGFLRSGDAPAPEKPVEAWPAYIDDPVTAESDPLNPWRR